MNRRQLEHVIRAACEIADDDELIVIGSQDPKHRPNAIAADSRVQRQISRRARSTIDITSSSLKMWCDFFAVARMASTTGLVGSMPRCLSQ